MDPIRPRPNPRAPGPGRVAAGTNLMMRLPSRTPLRRELTFVAALVAIGAILRFYHLGTNSIWIDELVTIRIASQPFGPMREAAARVNFCAPLYFWLVHGVFHTLGSSESSLRLISAIAGTATVPVAWLLTRETTGNSTLALVVAGLLTVNPLHVWYSQEGRQYALLMLFGLVSLTFLVRAVRTGATGDWLGFAIGIALTLLTHTTGIAFLVVAALWVMLRKRSVVGMRSFLAAAAGALLVVSPFLLTVLNFVTHAEGAHSPPRPLSGMEVPYTLYSFLAGQSFGPSVREIQELGGWSAIAKHPIQTGIVGGLLAVVLWLACRRRISKFWVLLVIVPLACAFAGAAASGKAYSVRYTLAGLFGLLGLAGEGIWRLRPAPRAGMIAALIGLSLWSDAQWYWTTAYRKEDSREAVTWLAANLPEGSRVDVIPEYAAQVLAYYAEIQGVRLRFVGLADSSSLADHDARALVGTRLHHVPNWLKLRRSFTAAGSASTTDLIGYHIVVLQ
jgi:4-amino-4-deoxy-L-arabinose transferase-like glycosyltransferase